MTTFHTLRRRSIAVFAFASLSLTMGATAALAAGDDADISVTGDCDSVRVTSSKDISNIVLQFEDGDTQKLDGLSGRSGTFSGTGSNAGETITTVWVKSGNNTSGDGPGHGERFNLDTSDCSSSETGSTGAESDTEKPAKPSKGDQGPKSDKGSKADEAPRTTTNAGDDASITVSGDCDDLRVTSTKDISNIVLQFEDSTTQKLDGLSGRSGTFSGTGSNADKVITGVWVKSGNNASGDGPGYGEFHSVDSSGCETGSTGSTTGTNTGSTGTNTGTTGSNTGATGSTGIETGSTGSDSGTTGTAPGATGATGSEGDDTGQVGSTGSDDEVGSAGATRDDARVLGVVLERDAAGAADEVDGTGLRSAAATIVSAIGQLPNTGAPALAAAVAALGALGLGGGLLARTRRDR